jgi:hypothetical protein
LTTLVKANFEALRKDYLSPHDWKVLRTINSFLQPFNRATLETQGDRVTLNKMLFTMDVLGKHIEKSLALYRTNKDLMNRI